MRNSNMTPRDEFEADLIKRLINLRKQLSAGHQSSSQIMWQTQKQLDTILQCISDGVIMADVAGKIVYANQAAMKLFGFACLQDMLDLPVTQLLGQFEIFDEQEQPLPDDQLPPNLAVQCGKNNRASLCFRSLATSTISWIVFTATPIFDENGLVKFVVMTLHDITAYKKSEDTLRRREEQISSIFRSAPIGIGLAVNRVIKKVNSHLCKITGYNEAELLDQNARMLYPDNEEYEFVGQEKYGQIANRGTGTVETRWRRKDGRLIDVLLNSTPLDVNDLSKGVTFTALDITERKRAEQALLRSESRYRTLFEQANDAFFVSTLDDRVVDVNRRACELLGYSREELLKLTVPDLQAPEVRGQLGTVIKEELVKSQDEPFESIDLHRDGTRIPVEVTTTPILGDNGRETLVLVVVRDITERKQAEQNLRRYAARLEALRKIERNILTASGPAEIANAALYHIQQMLPCLWASIAVTNAYDTQNFELLATTLGGETEIGAGEVFPKSLLNIPLLEQGKIDIFNEIQPPDNSAAVPRLIRWLYEQGVRSCIHVPLVANQQLIGTLNVAADHPYAYDSGHLEIASEIADSLAVAIHHAHLYEQARKDAATKATLLREVNHRVKNNLAAIIGLLYVEKNHIRMQDSELYRNIITDLIKRIEGIATVHQMLSDSEWMPLSLEQLTVKLLNSTFQVLPSGQSIDLEMNCPEEVFIIPKQANSLAILLNELMTNTVKYALPARNHITAHIDIKRLSNGQVRLCYHDDGPGFPSAVLQKRDFNVGLYLLHNIVVSDLQGDVTLSNDGGAKITIQFKPLT